LSRKQAQSYIDLYIASLNDGLRPHISDYDIQRMTNKTYTTFDQSSTVYIWVSGIRMYNKDMIDQFLLSAIIEVVESNTYSYAYDQTKNATTASKITQNMRTQLMKLIEKKQVLDAHNLRPFFGYPLKEAIRKEIANNTTTTHQHNNSSSSSNHQSHNNNATYASQSCCMCLDDFGGATERLFLKPCGHDMCKMCALDYFFPNNLPDQTKKCPICRSRVDMEELYNDVL